MAANLLLSGLPTAEQLRLNPFFERVELSDGEQLVGAGNPIPFVWFSEDAVLLTAQTLRNGVRIPAGLAGNDGVAGFELWLGRNTSPLSTTAEVGGAALRMTATNLQREVLNTKSALNSALSDYVFHFLTMSSQVAVCLQTHAPEERLCRWLQMIQLRAPGRDSFPLSESFLGSLLNTEPHTAVLAIRILEQAGLVEYRDHRIRIVDSKGLEEGCCECLSLFQERLSRMQSADRKAHT